jgi:hypothetical protein
MLYHLYLFLISVLGFLVASIAINFILASNHPQDNILHSLPWAGVRKEWFPKARAAIRTIRDVREILDKGYERVSDEEQMRSLAG